MCAAKQLDLAFVLDASGSIGSSNWPTIIDFCRDLVDTLTVGSAYSQVAVVIFSTSATVNFNLNSYLTKADVLAAIDRLVYTGGVTNLNAALGLLNTNVYADGNGMRAGAEKVAVIITDGVDNGGSTTIDTATTCKDVTGIRLMAVGGTTFGAH